MDILTFLTKVIDSLVWPIVVVAALGLFRAPLSALIDSLRNATLKWKKGDSTFEARLDTVRKELKDVTATASQKVTPPPAVEPSQQIIEKSWRELESTAASTLSTSGGVPPLKLANMLLERKILNEKEADAFYRLYELRTDALTSNSGTYTDVSSGSAFSSVAGSLAYEIKKRGA